MYLGLQLKTITRNGRKPCDYRYARRIYKSMLKCHYSKDESILLDNMLPRVIAFILSQLLSKDFFKACNAMKATLPVAMTTHICDSKVGLAALQYIEKSFNVQNR